MKYRLNVWLAELMWKLPLTQNSGEGGTETDAKKETEYMDHLSRVPEKLKFIHYSSDADLFQALAYLWAKNTDDIFKDEEDVQRACPWGSSHGGRESDDK